MMGFLMGGSQQNLDPLDKFFVRIKCANKEQTPRISLLKGRWQKS